MYCREKTSSLKGSNCLDIQRGSRLISIFFFQHNPKEEIQINVTCICFGQEDGQNLKRAVVTKLNKTFAK